MTSVQGKPNVYWRKWNLLKTNWNTKCLVLWLTEQEKNTQKPWISQFESISTETVEIFQSYQGWMLRFTPPLNYLTSSWRRQFGEIITKFTLINYFPWNGNDIQFYVGCNSSSNISLFKSHSFSKDQKSWHVNIWVIIIRCRLKVICHGKNKEQYHLWWHPISKNERQKRQVF